MLGHLLAPPSLVALNALISLALVRSTGVDALRMLSIGPHLANLAAALLVTEVRTEYIDPPHAARVASDRMAALLDWLAKRLDREVTVAQMARQVAMGERTFARRFKEATGTTPYRWVLQQRIRLAQELLETGDVDTDRLARQAGFGSPTTPRERRLTAPA